MKERILTLRLAQQLLQQPLFSKPEELLGYMGAMQAQDPVHIRWSVGCRLIGATDASIDQAFTDKKIVRTWSLRGTLHAHAAADVRWITALVAERLVKGMGARHRDLELDDSTLNRCFDQLQKAMAGKSPLTKSELSIALAQIGIMAEGIRLTHILWLGVMQQLFCLGPRRGSELTYVLLDEWVPTAKTIDRQTAAYTLALRYLQSHSPASLEDFIWWSGLTKTEALTAFSDLKNQLTVELVGDRPYYFFSEQAPIRKSPSPLLALPAFDEYLIAYTDRSWCLDPKYASKVVQSNGIFNPFILKNGEVIASWKRSIGKKEIKIDLTAFSPLSSEERLAIEQSFSSYKQFMNLPLRFSEKA